MKQLIAIEKDFLEILVAELRSAQEDVFVNSTQRLIEECEKVLNAEQSVGEISDGYHTFNELYEFRKVYNAALFNQWAKFRTNHPNENQELPMYNVHKSWRHNDGELCFGGGWFIVVAILPTGQISNHYKAEDWDLFKIPEVEKAIYPFDGHTSKDVLERLKNI